MDSRLNYAELAKKVILEYAAFYARGGITTLHPVFDEQRQSYVLLDFGWQDDRYLHHATIHLEIIDGKIWIQQDDTEEGLATDLLEVGVPPEDIVLGFRPPEVRPYTGFGAGAAAPDTPEMTQKAA
jgi:hypothetical protein